MQKPRSGRQVYNKEALSKASQSQRPRKIPQKNQIRQSSISQPILELEKEEESAPEEEKDQQNEKNEKPKKERTMKPRLKLDEKNLLYSDNGIKKYYEAIMSTTFKDTSSDQRNLNKLVDLYKNWHFILFPRYDAELFTSRLTALGKKAAVKAYMSRLRKIYKGEESWEVMYDEQNEILDKGKSAINKSQKNEDNNEQKNKESSLNNNHMQKPPMTIKLQQSNKNEINFEELILDNLAEDNNKNDLDEVNSKDFENMNDILREEEIEALSKDFENFSRSEVSSASRKRTYKEAFGDTIQIENIIENTKPRPNE